MPGAGDADHDHGGVPVHDRLPRLPDGAGYHFHLQAPTQAVTGTTDERAQIISQEIEHLIRQCPEQYLWGYNRYKRPRGVEAPPERA